MKNCDLFLNIFFTVNIRLEKLEQSEQKQEKHAEPVSYVNVCIVGGPADQCAQLQVHDEILDVNGEDLTGMRHSEAWQHLKFLPSGEVIMTIRRFSS